MIAVTGSDHGSIVQADSFLDAISIFITVYPGEYIIHVKYINLLP